ncbi:hypothetical protein NC652_041053 [Populus alba x Populus x berolinensis]|nr:hypothetical protein NC652_041053 [Populus alba x Populus x berolinensis]
MGSRKIGKQSHWFTYIIVVFRCSKPGATLNLRRSLG